MLPNEDFNLIPDVQRGGPLEPYRSSASFNWKAFKIFFDDTELIQYRYNIWETLRKDPLFTRTLDDLSTKQQKELTGKRVKRLGEYAFLTQDDLYGNPLKRLDFDEALVMWHIDAVVKYSLHYQMFQELIRSMGTARHEKYIEKCENYEYSGCFCMTEISHGSNTRELKTRATYDPSTEEFIINTPSIEDSKIWVGNLGKVATHAAVYAQLYTPDGACHGLHIFIVPIRDPYTMLNLPGVIVGDMGDKAGLNGVDNGFVTFNNVRIPRENLLNKTGDVTPDGRYVTPIKDTSKRLGISLGALSNGRVGLTFYATCFMVQALTVAVRYAAVRKQFGPKPGEEQAIIEYQLHQYRLMPHLAACIVWRNFSKKFFMNLAEFIMGLMANDTSERQSDLGKEIHAVSSVSKPASSWLAQQIIQECREACGGHGYLKSSRLSEFRNNNDPLLTFEGDNNVLIQQTSNYILNFFDDFIKNGKYIETPLECLDYLKRFSELNGKQFNTNDLVNKKTLIDCFDWLLCYLTKISFEKVQKNLKSNQLLFDAKNNAQVFYLKTLSLAFIDRLTIIRFMEKIVENEDATLEPVLNRILFLAGYHFIDKYLVYFYQGGYFQGEEPTRLIRDLILKLCSELKHDSVTLIDSIAPPDYVLNSALGNSDGLVYKHLYNSMIQAPGCFERLSWYNDFMDKKKFGSRRSNQAKL